MVVTVTEQQVLEAFRPGSGAPLDIATEIAKFTFKDITGREALVQRVTIVEGGDKLGFDRVVFEVTT